MTKDDIIKDLEQNIYCRIAPSPIEGVGVFAIRAISKGTQPLKTTAEVELIEIPEKEIMENKNIPDAVKELVKGFYVVKDGIIYFSGHSFNDIDISYFLNHSETPNLNMEEIEEESVFTANRDIAPGEELTINYSHF